MRSAASANTATEWVESLDPWPGEFGLGRMRRLLARLGEPQRAYPAVHVVGTNGKSTTARLIEALLTDAGLTVGTYLSPHVVRWDERIRVRGADADFEQAVGRVRDAADDLDATQFEAVTAAALLAFAEQGVDAAVVEAGLGGRLDATNVLRSEVVVLTNVALDHTDVLGETREAIATEKLAVLSPGATAVLGEPEWEALARTHGAADVIVAGSSNLALAIAAAEAFLGAPVDPAAAEQVRVPGRLEMRGEQPLEIWDGAHNLAGVGYLLARLPAREFVLVLSILADKDVDGMLAAFSALGETLVATASANARAVPASELARRAAPFFATVADVADPAEALATARELAGPGGAVLVAGSLYLLSALAAAERRRLPWDASASG
ncbi:MAG TPA: Mur ligase family protein [Gaiellaceae bacterium]|nr:Mur ligase family protein [Gaiellaceae bacterium]